MDSRSPFLLALFVLCLLGFGACAGDPGTSVDVSNDNVLEPSDSDLASDANADVGHVDTTDVAGLDDVAAAPDTPDETAPEWPAGASILISDLGESSVTLAWPAAVDDVGVESYAISVLGGQKVTVGPATLQLTLDGLPPGAVQTFRVRATDVSGNDSAPLQASAHLLEGCLDDLTFFEQFIWQPVMSDTCAGCHVAGGAAEDTLLVLSPGSETADLVSNYDALKPLALDKSQGASLLLLKPSGQVPHAGGLLFDPSSDHYSAFEELLGRLQHPGGCVDPATVLTCADAPISPGPTRLRRLTSNQYKNTVNELFQGLVSSPGSFPETVVVAGFSSYAGPNVVSATGARGILDAAETIAAAFKEHVTTLAPCANLGQVACGIEFIKSFGHRAFRRPLNDGELAVFFGVLEQAPVESSLGDKLGAVVEAFLQSPQFLYISVDPGAEVPGQADLFFLSDDALASRLSYFLWDSMPDEVLLARAAAGGLNDPAAIAEEVTRMLDDPRAHAMVARFHREWLHLYRLETLTKSPEVYPTFTPALVAAMVKEVDLLVQKVFFEPGGGLFHALLDTQATFVNATLATHYGLDNVPPGDTWQPATLGPARQGLLTRAAFATAHAYPHASSPIHRGHFVLQELLCQKLVIPPVQIGELPPADSAKDRLELHRADPLCASCHLRIDPLGIAFEQFDGIGAFRTAYENGVPVAPQGSLESPLLNFVDAASLSDQLKSMPTVQSCYATQWFRFAAGRSEQYGDACSLESIEASFKLSGGNMLSLLHAITQSDAFRYRAGGSDD